MENTEKAVKKSENPTKKEFPAKAPFGATIIWGQKGVGKTLAVLNSPWQPVHVIDTELSSADYFIHQQRLIEKEKILRGPFTRAECLDWPSTRDEIYRICGYKFNPNNPDMPIKVGDGVYYGTIGIDTGGQWSEWVSDDTHKTEPKGEKLGQIVWGKVRSRIRNTLIMLSSHCDCLLLTAHEREYAGKKSPRCNPALLEITAISVRLQREPNTRLPSAQFIASRVPFFPPSIPVFSISRMLPFFDMPADWNNLSEDEKIKKEEITSMPEEIEES